MTRISTHPGEILHEDYLLPLGLSATKLALDIGVPPNRMSEIVKARRAITPDTALRLERYFGQDAGWWLALQAQHDLSVERAAKAGEINRRVIPRERMSA